ncbi:MAG: hypothetical protein K6F64_04010 [Clostridia bacterium]|nr:hypothetical protein [Clostridia bacterium]
MIFRKLIAVIISVIMIAGLLPTAFAAEETQRDCPYIYVHGFMAKDIHADKDNRDSDVIWPPSTDSILNTVKECLPALIKFAATRNYDALADAIIDPFKDLLGVANLDKDGNVPDGSGVYFVYPPKDSIGKDSSLDFNFDWRIDPIEVAGQLNDFINYVLDASGCDQVVLQCHSFGGIITASYVQLYGDSKLRSVCYDTTAIYGETYTGELLSGNIVVRADALTDYLKCLLGDNQYRVILRGILDMLNDAGITDEICSLANKLIENLGPVAIKEVVLPMFGGWPSIWAMIPDEYYDSAYNYVFDTVYKEEKAEYSGLIGKIENYNSQVRANKTQNLKSQNDDLNLYVISRYGFTSVPLTESWDNMSDSTIDTKYSSFGAYCAKYNTTFSEAFIAEHENDEYMNKDGSVYASYCLFPEQTWFVKNMHHAKEPGSLEDMIFDLLYYDGQATVKTFEEYPRFLEYDVDSGAISPDIGTEPEKTGFFRRIMNQFVLAWNSFVSFIKGIVERE